ncbi:unnamed protein product, partial [Allacma fusca]
HRVLDKHFLNALIVIYVVLMVTGLFSNTMVWIVVARRAQMRTPRNFYVVNLTVSDITLCLISMPFTLINFIQMQWKLGVVLCKLVPVVQGTNIFVSTGTVMAIALDRYFTIVRSCGAPQDKYRVLLSIAVIWIVSCLFVFPILIYQGLVEETIGNYIVGRHCIEKWPSSSMRAAYTIGLLVFQLLIPILVLAGVHVAIANHLNSHKFAPTSENAGSCKSKFSKRSFLRSGKSKRKESMARANESSVMVDGPTKCTILNGSDNTLYNIPLNDLQEDECQFLPQGLDTYPLNPISPMHRGHADHSETNFLPLVSTGAEEKKRASPSSLTDPSGRKFSESRKSGESKMSGESRNFGESRKSGESRRSSESLVVQESLTNYGGQRGLREIDRISNYNARSPLNVNFKSNIGVCITFREFCQLSTGKGSNGCSRPSPRILESHNNMELGISEDGKRTGRERKLSEIGNMGLEQETILGNEISLDRTCRLGRGSMVGDQTDSGRDEGQGRKKSNNGPLTIVPTPPSKSPNNPAAGATKRTKKELARNKRTTIILLSVAVIFTISWMPWHLLTLWADLHPNFTSTKNLYMLYAVCHIIAMTSAVTNAVLYGWLNTNLRRELMQVRAVLPSSSPSILPGFPLNEIYSAFSFIKKPPVLSNPTSFHFPSQN